MTDYQITCQHLPATIIRRLMRANRKTIRGITTRWGLTQKRVRYVREHGVSGEAFVRDWMEILTAPEPVGHRTELAWINDRA